MTEDVFDDIYETNLKSAMFLAQSVARRQIDAGNGGRHIHLLSVRSKLALRERGYSAYCATKGALTQMTKSMALALAKYGIRVNAIGPGSINTDVLKAVNDNPEAMDKIMSRTPLGRIGDAADDIGPVAVFLASDLARHMTGQTLAVDGGRYLGL